MSLTAKRSPQNPILAPNEQNSWEAQATFNGSVVKKDKRYHMLYRAISEPQFYFGQNLELSSIGHAVGTDGVAFEKRRQLITPEYEWEQFGCEDPRVTELDGKFFVFYTALSDYPHTAEGIKIGLAITRDFEEIEAKHQITHFNSKAGTLFPERINGKLAMMLSVGTDRPPTRTALALLDNEKDLWSKEFWQGWLETLDKTCLRLKRDDQDHIEIGATPVKTKDGWLLVYSHIQNYFQPPAVFGVEAVLLDLKNPLHVIGQTKKPIMIPTEEYELYGKVPNIVFPSGAIIENEILNIYYGAADTTTCLAQLELEDLLREINPKRKRPVAFKKKVKLERSLLNPILQPIPDHSWESKNVFNTAALFEDGRVHLLYRAMGEDETSVLGYASSTDGVNIDERLETPVYLPREPFEKKATLGGSGCEDPRLTKIGNQIYICYTAFSGQDPTHIALTSISLDDFLNKDWQWKTPKIISCPERSDKNACLFPDLVNGKYVFFHRIGGCIWVDYRDSLDFGDHDWLGGKILMCPNMRGWDSFKIGIAGPPHKTEDGWLLVYHALSAHDDYYRLGALLLDLNQPERIIAKLDYPILEPEEPYEKEGFRPNTIFSCGSVVIDKRLFVYYGAADEVVGVASVEVEKLLKAFYRPA